jgi:hypothetical protein
MKTLLDGGCIAWREAVLADLAGAMLGWDWHGRIPPCNF